MALIRCNVVDNSYQQGSKVLNKFVLNKFFGESLNISPKMFTLLRKFDSEFSLLEYDLLIKFLGY